MASHDLPGALAASVAAAQEATAVLAPAEALQHFERALQLWDAVDGAQRPPRTTAVALALAAATAATRAGNPHRALALSHDAVRRCDEEGSSGTSLRARRALAVALLSSDRPGQALEVVEETISRHTSGAEPSDVAWLEAIAARSRASLGHFPEAAARAARALELARAAGARDAEADALVTLAAVRGSGGEAGAAVPLLEDALRLARSTGNLGVELRVTYNLVVTVYESGDVVQALRDVDAAVRRAEETGLPWSEYGLELRVLQVLVRYAAGDFPGSRRLAELTGRRPSQAVLARISAAAALAAVARGDDDAAAEIARLEARGTTTARSPCSRAVLGPSCCPGRGTQRAPSWLSTRPSPTCPGCGSPGSSVASGCPRWGWLPRATWPTGREPRRTRPRSRRPRTPGPACWSGHASPPSAVSHAAGGWAPKVSPGWLAQRRSGPASPDGPTRRHGAGRWRPPSMPRAVSTGTSRPAAAGGWPRHWSPLGTARPPPGKRLGLPPLPTGSVRRRCTEPSPHSWPGPGWTRWTPTYRTTASLHPAH